MNAQQLLLDAAKDLDNGAAVRSYSGRGMFGRNCVGITGTLSDCQAVVAGALTAAMEDLFTSSIDTDDSDREAYNKRDQVATLIDQLTKFSWDNMGYDVVLYFPNLKWEEVEEEEIDDVDG
jgi:hypothetical protein